ncbi:hypothetical protein A0127_07065 [Thermococcus peptonophilus]|uniref:Uncharacterized protein n=1 Tax=Thermococcus peptonophilus TaxID=53952 RepID=A0A142CVZ4_9EURY|nr:hypothetical protein A0127_07065 [Thermococcus peptonophilus]
MRSALLNFVIALVSYLIFGLGLFPMFLTIGFFFLLLDRLGIPAVELDVGGSVYRIYPSRNFSEIVVEGEERKTFPLLPGKNTIEVRGKVIAVYLVPRRFFPSVLIEFDGEKLKLV